MGQYFLDIQYDFVGLLLFRHTIASKGKKSSIIYLCINQCLEAFSVLFSSKQSSKPT